MGYAAPEYVRTGHLTSKSDVWSYGVFLYELITGRRPLERNRPKNEQKLLVWMKPYLSDLRKFEQILDPRLDRKQILKSAIKLSIVANRCLVRASKTRPKMSEVAVMVREVLEAEEPRRSVDEAAARAETRPVDTIAGRAPRPARPRTRKIGKPR